MSAPISMTYATGLCPLPTLLEALGGSKSVARTFAAPRLPFTLVSDLTHRAPLPTKIVALSRLARRLVLHRIGGGIGVHMRPSRGWGAGGLRNGDPAFGIQRCGASSGLAEGP
jgi:hypothetical protein